MVEPGKVSVTINERPANGKNVKLKRAMKTKRIVARMPPKANRRRNVGRTINFKGRGSFNKIRPGSYMVKLTPQYNVSAMVGLMFNAFYVSFFSQHGDSDSEQFPSKPEFIEHSLRFLTRMLYRVNDNPEDVVTGELPLAFVQMMASVIPRNIVGASGTIYRVEPHLRCMYDEPNKSACHSIFTSKTINADGAQVVIPPNSYVPEFFAHANMNFPELSCASTHMPCPADRCADYAAEQASGEEALFNLSRRKFLHWASMISGPKASMNVFSRVREDGKVVLRLPINHTGNKMNVSIGASFGPWVICKPTDGSAYTFKYVPTKGSSSEAWMRHLPCGFFTIDELSSNKLSRTGPIEMKQELVHYPQDLKMVNEHERVYQVPGPWRAILQQAMNTSLPYKAATFEFKFKSLVSLRSYAHEIIKKVLEYKPGALISPLSAELYGLIAASAIRVRQGDPDAIPTLLSARGKVHVPQVLLEFALSRAYMHKRTAVVPDAKRTQQTITYHSMVIPIVCGAAFDSPEYKYDVLKLEQPTEETQTRTIQIESIVRVYPPVDKDWIQFTVETHRLDADGIIDADAQHGTQGYMWSCMLSEFTYVGGLDLCVMPTLRTDHPDMSSPKADPLSFEPKSYKVHTLPFFESFHTHGTDMGLTLLKAQCNQTLRDPNLFKTFSHGLHSVIAHVSAGKFDTSNNFDVFSLGLFTVCEQLTTGDITSTVLNAHTGVPELVFPNRVSLAYERKSNKGLDDLQKASLVSLSFFVLYSNFRPGICLVRTVNDGASKKRYATIEKFPAPNDYVAMRDTTPARTDASSVVADISYGNTHEAKLLLDGLASGSFNDMHAGILHKMVGGAVKAGKKGVAWFKKAKDEHPHAFHHVSNMLKPTKTVNHRDHGTTYESESVVAL